MIKTKLMFVIGIVVSALCFMGCKAEVDCGPDKIGDIAYYNSEGQYKVYADYKEEYGTPIGIVFDTENGYAIKILSLTHENSAFQWVKNTDDEKSEGYDIVFNTSAEDGSGNWSSICSQVTDYETKGNYPAFERTFEHKAGNLTWYLPAINELEKIVNNVDIINNSLDLLKGHCTITKISTEEGSCFWSSTQDIENYWKAWAVAFFGRKKLSNGKHIYYKVLPVAKLK